MNEHNKIVLILYVLIEIGITGSLVWDGIPCSTDSDQNVPDGIVSNIGRFPWLGVIQHSFYIGGKTHFAITMGVLIHPSYVISPAEDIARILRDRLLNNTQFVIWYSKDVKYAMEVIDYVMHPEYEDSGILATMALLELDIHGETTFGENKEAVLPVCLPISGGEFPFSGMFAVKMTDENVELQKEMYKMKYVNDTECNEFYVKNGLTLAKMSPVSPLCACTEREMPTCVWDGGVALIARQSWGIWKILGFGVRGPGCGAPARFLVIQDYMSWINEVMTHIVDKDVEGMEEGELIGFRRLSPNKIIMYSAGQTLPREELGNCDRKARGSVQYKESFELLATKDFGQGFFYVIVHQIAQFNCATIFFEEVIAKTNTSVWIEHYCNKELTGIAHGQKKPKQESRRDCFAYFKSAAFVKFRFYFSSKAKIEMTLYGRPETPRNIPDPFSLKETTDIWYPTPESYRIHWDTFGPYIGLWYWSM